MGRHEKKTRQNQSSGCEKNVVQALETKLPRGFDNPGIVILLAPYSLLQYEKSQISKKVRQAAPRGFLYHVIIIDDPDWVSSSKPFDAWVFDPSARRPRRIKFEDYIAKVFPNEESIGHVTLSTKEYLEEMAQGFLDISSIKNQHGMSIMT